MKTPLVFSLVKEQSMFMTIIMSILSFLSILSLGIALSIGTGVINWNNQWKQSATIQILHGNNVNNVKKIFDENKNSIVSINEISKAEMEKIVQPWVSNGAKLTDYLPQTFEVKFKTTEDMKRIGAQINLHAKFLTHIHALQSSISTGWKMVTITSFVLIMMLISIGICISYISRNVATLHRHELEILNQVGATDSFVARQMQIIVSKISGLAAIIGFVVAVPILLLILSSAHSARIGMLAMLALSNIDWIILALLPILIVILSIYITKKTTLKILADN
ncbi:MAG: hypothetical protein MJ156_02475 [Alphaproteobacteria bacterium]|nr:hypothetical protein [Alphaproteobacteria bacterium]